MFWQILHAEIGKLLRQTLVAALLSVMGLMAFLVCVATINNTPEFSLKPAWGEVIATNITLAASFFGAMMTVLLAGMNLGYDYQRRWVHLWISHGASRRSLILAKLVVLLLPLFLIPLVMLVISLPLSAAMLAGYHEPVALDLINFGVLQESVFLVVLSLLPYALIASLLAVVGRSITLPLSIGFLWVLGEQFAIQVLLGAREPWHTIGTWLPGNLAQSLSSLNWSIPIPPTDVFLSQPVVEPAPAIIGLFIWILLLSAAIVYRFEHQDLS
jgi:ABC-type transport system involved in multi-copper enzyme maturation permease subunit